MSKINSTFLSKNNNELVSHTAISYFDNEDRLHLVKDLSYFENFLQNNYIFYIIFYIDFQLL